MRKYKWYKKKYINRKTIYTVSIFKNGTEYRKLYERRFLTSAINMFNKELKNNVVYFPVRFANFMKPEFYELVICSNSGTGLRYHPNNEIKTPLPTLKDEGFVIKKIEPYRVEEKFIRYGYKRKVTFSDFVKIILKNKNKTLTVNWFKNKIYIEDFEQTISELFIFKNEFDCKRFINILRKFLVENKLYDVLIMSEAKTTPERSELYRTIMSSMDVTREYLFRPYTH